MAVQRPKRCYYVFDANSACSEPMVDHVIRRAKPVNQPTNLAQLELDTKAHNDNVKPNICCTIATTSRNIHGITATDLDNAHWYVSYKTSSHIYNRVAVVEGTNIWM